MANNKDSSDSKSKKSSFCGHLMFGFDNHRYCYKCREASKGDDLCTLKKDCLLCIALSEDQKRKLTEKLSKGKKSLKESTLQKGKDKIDDSILDEEDSSVGISSQSVVAGQTSGSNSQALAAILSQLTTLTNRIAAIESKDSPVEADILVANEAVGRASSQCKKRSTSSTQSSEEIHSKRHAEENPTTSVIDNRFSIPTKKARVELSDDGEYDSSQEDKQPVPSYSDTLFAIKKWLDIAITETDTIIAPSVFSQASKLKKSAEVSLALPPAENMCSLWDFKEYEASGVSKEHDSLKTKSSRRNPLPRGQFLNFERLPMKWYNISPQPHAVVAPKSQDAFRNITSSQFQMPSAISTPWKQSTLWETVNRENINVLNHIFWFNSAIYKATEEMEKQFAILKSAENETDFNNALEYVQECLQLQSSVNQSLGKSLDSLLGSSMTMASNMLLSRRDNYLKSCSKDITEDDISKLRNAPFTSNEVFPVDTLSEVQKNFIQWSHVNRESRGRDSRKEHTARHEEKRDSRSQNRSFRPYHENSSTTSARSNSSSATGNRGRGSYSSRPFRGRGGRRK